MTHRFHALLIAITVETRFYRSAAAMSEIRPFQKPDSISPMSEEENMGLVFCNLQHLELPPERQYLVERDSARHER